MIPLNTGTTLLTIAHAHRRDDLARAAESRMRAEFADTTPDREHRHRPRHWWWGLARPSAT